MRVAAISDLHGNLPDYREAFKDVELLLICGDIAPLNVQANNYKSKRWFNEEFSRWIDSLPIQKCFFIAGNHDFLAERSPDWIYTHFTKSDKATYLCNDSIDYISSDGNVYSIFGTPYCHIFGNWPFMRDGERLEKYFDQMPEFCDIVISHDAPYGTSDICFQFDSSDEDEHRGNIQLREAILKKDPRYLFHGHLHSSNHDLEFLGDTRVFNTSVIDENYELKYEPLILNINKNE